MIAHEDDFADWDPLAAGEEKPFGDEVEGIEWRGKTHRTVQRDAGGRPIALVALLVTEVEAGGQRFEVVGVGSVMVTRAHRGTGLLRPLLDAALARDLGPERAMLFCTEANAPIYARLGFERVTGAVTVEQAAGPLVMPLVTMWKPLRPGVTWPAGDVTVPGLPF